MTWKIKRKRASKRGDLGKVARLFGLGDSVELDHRFPDNKKILSFIRGKPTTFYLSPKSKKYFKAVQALPFETGGRLDFNLDRVLERVQSRFGTERAIIENFRDFEAEYHVHPKGYKFNPPSPGDFRGFGGGIAENILRGRPPTQVGVVFSEKLIYVIYFDYNWLKRNFTAKTRKGQMKKYLKFIYNDDEDIYFRGFLENRTAHDKYIKASSRKYGIKVYTFRWDQRIPIRLAPEEPLLENLSESKRDRSFKRSRSKKRKRSKKNSRSRKRRKSRKKSRSRKPK